MDAICAVDIYTGRIAWQHEFTDRQGDQVTLLPPARDSRVVFDSKTPSAARRDAGKVRRVGYNMACAEDGLYVAYGKKCLRLDPATGKIIDRLTLSSTEAGRPPPYWVDLRIWQNLLVATAVSTKIPTDAQGLPPKALNSYRKAFLDNLRIGSLEVVPANLLVGLDRHSGKVLWQREAARGFLGPKFVWHGWGTFNAANDCLAVGNGKVFCLDGMDPDVHQAMVRRGHAVRAGNELLAIDARTGSVIWRSPVAQTCTLSYSVEHDVLVEVTPDLGTDYPHASGFTANRMCVRQGTSGQILWQKTVAFRGPSILYHDTLISQTGEALDLLTGKTRMRNHPLTGAPISWGSIDRTYGCNYAVGSEHLLTFRSSTAGYSDIRHNVTGTFGGFRTGCTNSLIPAGGLLNLPNLANSCYCNYQNQTSLALVPMPEAETWTWTRPPPATRAIRRVGLNLGAPGDRLAENGTLWLDYPSVGGPSPDIPVRITPESPRWYYHHASRIERGPLRWVVSSGVEGLESITLMTAATGDSDSGSAEEPSAHKYTVRLYFAELSGRRPGERVFDVSLQGRMVLQNFDIWQAAGRANVGIVREFTAIRIADALTIRLEPKQGRPLISGIELMFED
ncbi:MAG: malectin domain-containing carbohydrate-binding protein, partial [Pirellulales bacterium]